MLVVRSHRTNNSRTNRTGCCFGRVLDHCELKNFAERLPMHFCKEVLNYVIFFACLSLEDAKSRARPVAIAEAACACARPASVAASAAATSAPTSAGNSCTALGCRRLRCAAPRPLPLAAPRAMAARNSGAAGYYVWIARLWSAQPAEAAARCLAVKKEF